LALSVVSIAAATAVLGYNLLTNRPDIAGSGRHRAISSLGLTGSAAAGDAAVDVKVGDRVVATMYNSATGFPAADSGAFKVGPFLVPAGTNISVPVIDAPATNPLNFLIDV